MIEDDPIYLKIAQEVRDDLTLQEMIVIFSLLFGFALQCVKNKFCPNSWSPSNKIEEKSNEQEGESSTDIQATDRSSHDDRDLADNISDLRLNSLTKEMEVFQSWWPKKQLTFGETLKSQGQ